MGKNICIVIAFIASLISFIGAKSVIFTFFLMKKGGGFSTKKSGEQFYCCFSFIALHLMGNNFWGDKKF